MSYSKRGIFNKMIQQHILPEKQLIICFNDRIIRRNSEILYSTKSCDINTCNFFVWSHTSKIPFCSTPIHNLEELRNFVTGKYEEINKLLQMIHNVFAELTKRFGFCLDVDGQQFL